VITAEAAERCYEFERDHWWYRGRRRILLRLLDRFLGPGRHQILDVGAGTGYLHSFMGRFGAVRGIESDPEFVRQARARNLNLEVMDFPRQYPRESFDVVLLFDVLEHLEDDLQGLSVIHSMLKPSGLFFMTVPALPWLYSTYDQEAGHYRRYDAPLLRKRLRQSGFQVLHLTHFNTLLMPLAVAVRLLRLRPNGSPLPSTFAERCGSLHDRDLQIPPRPLNGLLERLLGCESAWMTGPGFGTGVSLAAVCRRA